MAALSDASIGIGTESTYGTAVSPTRWYEHISESLGYDKGVQQGQGLRVGSKVARSTRRVVTTTQAKGSFEVELTTKGMGLLLAGCLGTGSSTVATGSAYQQVFTLADTPTPWTLQKGVVTDAGTVYAHTYSGVLVDKWELSAGNGEIVKLKADVDCQALTTSTTYSAPSYTATPSLYHFAQGAVTLGGTVTAPTTTVSATGGTAVANVREFTLTGDNALNADRFNFGGGGKKTRPLPGLRKLSGKLVIEYTDNTVRDAFIADTELALSLTFTSTEAITGGTAIAQVVLAGIKLNGDIPQANGTDLVTLDVGFDVLDNLTAAQPIWIVMRTADAAL